MRVRSPNGPGRQRGATTLLIVTLLLFGMSLMLVYASRTVITEQRLAGNDVLARAGFAAAQAGLEAAFAELSTANLQDIAFDGNGWMALDGPAAVLDNGASYSTVLSNRDLNPFHTDLLVVEATGSPPDGSGFRAMRQLARVQAWLANPPPAPLVVAGNAGVEEIELINQHQPFAAWIGGEFTADGATTIELPDDPRCPPQGVCANDQRVADLSRAAFFENFLGRTPALLHAVARDLFCANCPATTPDPGVPVLWLDGPDNTVSFSGTIGTEENPVILVVNGDLRFIGDAELYGLLYVHGDWLPGLGRISLRGSMIVAGDIMNAGPARLQYEPALLERLRTTGPYVRVAGSWSDF